MLFFKRHNHPAYFIQFWVKAKRVILILILLFFTAALIVQPERYMASVMRGLNLFAAAVLPSLLPFFFFSKLLTSLDIASGFSRLSKKPMQVLFRAPPVAGYILTMSMLSGYPVGAKLITELHEQGVISASDARASAGFTLTSGPLFVIGSVGVAFLHNKTAGIVLLVAHFLSALLNGFFYRGKKPTACQPTPIIIDYDRILSDAITNTVVSLLIVGGYIAIFSMILDVLTDIGLLSGFATMLSSVGFDSNLAEGLAGGIVEMTRGAEAAAQSTAPLPAVLATIGAIIGFGGLSIGLQSVTFLKKAGVSVLRYFCIKLTHALLAAGITYLLALAVFG